MIHELKEMLYQAKKGRKYFLKRKEISLLARLKAALQGNSSHHMKNKQAVISGSLIPPRNV